MSEGPPAAASAKMKADLIAVIPNLRAFAVSLCGNPDRADDLVQETLVKAWSNLGSFVEGTNLPAWLFTNLRNIYYSEYRKRRREVADSDGTIAAKLATAPAQNGHMDLLDFRVALQQLPNDQRDAMRHVPLYPADPSKLTPLVADVRASAMSTWMHRRVCRYSR